MAQDSSSVSFLVAWLVGRVSCVFARTSDVDILSHVARLPWSEIFVLRKELLLM
jgi:hypothetical protein